MQTINNTLRHNMRLALQSVGAKYLGCSGNTVQVRNQGAYYSVALNPAAPSPALCRYSVCAQDRGDVPGGDETYCLTLPEAVAQYVQYLQQGMDAQVYCCTQGLPLVRNLQSNWLWLQGKGLPAKYVRQIRAAQRGAA